jgi:hypothetical protein
MSTPIGDLLPRNQFQEPPEVKIIKQYMQNTYQQDVGVTIKPREIIISVKGAALAGTLRMRLHELKELCQTDKRLVIRIG